MGDVRRMEDRVKGSTAKQTITILLISAALFCQSPAIGQTRDQVMGASARCYGIADDRQWLDCYYGAAQPMRARLGLPAAPASQQNLVPPPAGGFAGSAPAPAPLMPPPSTTVQKAAPQQKPRPGFFGRLMAMTEPSQQKPEPPTRMSAFRFDAAGYFTVQLANGETWRQSQGDIARARWRGKPDSYVVTVLPGNLSTTRMLKVAGDQVYVVEPVGDRR